MKLFKHAVYNKTDENILRKKAEDIVDRVVLKEQDTIEYVLSVLKEVYYERYKL